MKRVRLEKLERFTNQMQEHNIQTLDFHNVGLYRRVVSVGVCLSEHVGNVGFFSWMQTEFHLLALERSFSKH